MLTRQIWWPQRQIWSKWSQMCHNVRRCWEKRVQVVIHHQKSWPEFMIWQNNLRTGQKLPRQFQKSQFYFRVPGKTLRGQFCLQKVWNFETMKLFCFFFFQLFQKLLAHQKNLYFPSPKRIMVFLLTPNLLDPRISSVFWLSRFVTVFTLNGCN